MKKILAVLILLSCVFLGSCERRRAERHGAPSFAEEASVISAEVTEAFNAAGLPIFREGRRPTNFTLPLLDGSTVTLSDLRGQVVFLNFWATWCPPCRDEMPSMERLYQELSGRGLTILAINLREPTHLISPFVEEYNLTFPIALDAAGNVSRQYGVQAIPTSFILDRRGFIISRKIGFLEWDEPPIVAAFEALLDQ